MPGRGGGKLRRAGHRAPPSTVTLPRAYLWVEAGSTGNCHSAGPLAQVCGAMLSSTAAGMPISASTNSPHKSRPGSSEWPGLRRKKVTVHGRLRRPAADRAGGAVHPAGHVHRQDAAGGGKRVGHHAVHVARQPGAEHRVDHQVGTGGLRGVKSAAGP